MGLVYSRNAVEFGSIVRILLLAKEAIAAMKNQAWKFSFMIVLLILIMRSYQESENREV